MRHVFITGAAGFIGSYVAEEFIKQGWHVIALVHKRTSARLDALIATGRVVCVDGDIRDYESLRGAMLSAGEEIDVIVHCAGRASDVGWKGEFRRTNLESVQHLTRLTKELTVERLVFLSTTDVYGLLDHGGEAEDELPLRACPANPYPKFKILAEEAIRRELPPHRFSILRPAQVWGVGDVTLTKRIVDFLRWSPWIVHFGKWRGKNRWPLAHVRNVAMAAHVVVTSTEAAGQAINVVDSENTCMDDFYRILARAYLPEKEFKTITLPFWTGYVFGSIVSSISNILNLNHPFTDPSLYALYSVSRNLDFSNASLRKMLSDAGRRMVTLAEGVEELG